MIKAIFFDIDGTVISMDTHEIPASALAALYKLKEKGLRLFIASGRPPVHIPLLCQDFREFPWDGYILLNGQYCTDENFVPFYKKTIDPRTMETLIPWLKEQKDMRCSIFELDYTYELNFSEGMYEYYKSLGKLDQLPPVDDPERAYTHDTYQICPYVPAEQDEEFLAHAPYMKSARWNPNFADMIPYDGGKPEGVRQMLERFGISREECMAFGDGGNDITMLEYAGIGVAMGNCFPEVREHADYVTKAIDEDGLYHAFKHFGLL